MQRVALVSLVVGSSHGWFHHPFLNVSRVKEQTTNKGYMGCDELQKPAIGVSFGHDRLSGRLARHCAMHITKTT